MNVEETHTLKEIVRNQNMILNLTLNINKKIEYYIKENITQSS